MTRQPVRFIAVALLVLMLAATAAAQERTKVTVWLIGNEETGAYGQVWKHIKQEVEKDLPHIELEVLFGVSPDTRFITAYAAGIAPDVVTLSTATAPQFINKGMVSPLDFSAFGVEDVEGFRNLFYHGALKSMYVGDQIYFMPVEVTTFGMYYNIDLMQQYGVSTSDIPRTWDEIIEIGKKFMRRSQDGSTYDTVGLALNRGWIWPSFRWVALMRQYGTDWIVDGRPMFDSPQAIEAFTDYVSLFHENQVTVPVTGQQFFLEGRAPFYLGPSYEVRDIREKAQFAWGTAGYPSKDPNRRVSTSYAWGLYVSSSSQVKKEAWEVIAYLTSERWAPVWYHVGALLIPRSGEWILDVIAQQPEFAAFIEELEFAQLELFHEKYQQIRSAMTTADNEMVSRVDSVANILTRFNQQVTAWLNE